MGNQRKQWQNPYLKETGTVLIIVIILSTLIAMMAHLGMKSAILQQKMVHNFKIHEASKKNAEKTLVSIEKKLASNFDIMPEHVDYLQFVPDTLAFEEKNGSDFYAIEVKKKDSDGANIHLISTLSLRKLNLSPLYISEQHRDQAVLSLYFPSFKHLKHIFSWQAPKNVRLSEALYIKEPKNLTFVLGNDGFLYAINNRGETDLIFNIKQFIKEPLISDELVSPLLKKIEIIWNERSHTILLGVLSTNSPVVFALDITESQSLVDASGNALLWYKILEENMQINDLTLSRLINNKGVAIVSGVCQGNGSHILFVDLFSGFVLKTFNLDEKITSKVVPVDVQTQGVVDVFYLGDEQGTIWKGDLRSLLPENWFIKEFKGLIEGKIVGTPLVGYHPQAKSLLLFLLVENTAKQRRISTIADNHVTLSNFYKLSKEVLGSQPVLWQNYLLFQETAHQVGIYEAFTGKLLQTVAIQPPFEETHFQSDQGLIRILIDKPYDPHPLIMVSTTQGTSYGKASILSNRLGRKAWEIKYH